MTSFIKQHRFIFLLAGILMTTSSFSIPQQTKAETKDWGKVENKRVQLVTLTNANGIVLKVTNFAGSIVDVKTPDKNGIFESVVLGFDRFEDYLGRHPNFGSTIGRYAGRISDARIRLDNKEYQLQANRGTNCIHGGKDGMGHKTFTTDTVYVKNDTAITRFSYMSPAGEGGFPGNLKVSLTYMLTPEDEIVLQYEAITDQPTVVNFTNHAYFNLSGGKESVLHDMVKVKADNILTLDNDGKATGTFTPVKKTPFDFSKKMQLQKQMKRLPKDLDRTYQLKKNKDRLTLAAILSNPTTGRILEAYTTEPAMQLFVSGRDLSEFTGHGGIKYGKFYGICLEMQHYPDSPHLPQLPSTVLRPGGKYTQTTIYKFKTKGQKKFN